MSSDPIFKSGCGLFGRLEFTIPTTTSPSANRVFRSFQVRHRDHKRHRHRDCARAASDHVAAVPPKSVMNSRRFMVTPFSQRLHPTTSLN
jgi:hypothetical protein